MHAKIIHKTQDIKVPVSDQDKGDCGCNNPVKALWGLVPRLISKNKDKEVYRFPGIEVEIKKVK